MLLNRLKDAVILYFRIEKNKKGKQIKKDFRTKSLKNLKDV